MRDQRAFAIILVSLLLAAFALRAGTTTYVYDARGRLVAATPSSGLTAGYTYDQAGNRTQTATAAPPVANGVAVTVATNSSSNPVTLSIAGSFTSVSIGTGAAHGTATASGTSVTYAPTTGYAGADSFTYKATNASGTSGAATVQVAVAPVAANVGDTVAYGSSGNPVPLSVTGAYTAASVSSLPSHGTAFPSGTTIAYTPAAGYSGPDSFLYVASNAVATSAPATASITVNPQPPIANPVSATINENSPATNVPLSITGGTPTSVAVASPASHGTATASGITISYKPTTGYSGSDSFTYTASNVGGTSPAAAAAITVQGLTVIATTTFDCPPTGSYYVCATSTTASFTFTGTSITLSVTGGSGSYTYLWSANGDGDGNWATGQTTSSVTPSVSSVLLNNSTTANYTCRVTDTVSGAQATSNSIQVTYTRN